MKKKGLLTVCYKSLNRRLFTLFVTMLLVSLISHGQVGINTTNPNAILDIRSSNQVSPANNDGILIPKINNFSSVNPTGAQDGMLVFATGNGTPSKGFYYWNNVAASWVLITGGGSGGGSNSLDQAYDQGGAGIGKNILATDGAVRIAGDDGFLVTGSLGTGNTIDTEITGAGTRLFFNPNKGAFRAGTIFNDAWDDINTGVNSVAFGRETHAFGEVSTAFGNFTSAQGWLSTAFGSASQASGSTATAFGGSTVASGDLSTAFGSSTNASGSTSTAFGSSTTASGTGSTAFGGATGASGLYATAFGTGTNASGNHSTAFGSATNASENYSTAFGYQTTASEEYSTAMGYQTIASGNRSIAFGSLTTASGNISTAFGLQTIASGSLSTAFGYGIVAPSSYETAIGTFNTLYTPVVTGSGYSLQDRLFVVGKGLHSSQRSNALTIYKSGLININDAYNLPLVDGAANQVLTTNGAGVLSFQNQNSGTIYTLNQAYSQGNTGAGRIISAIYGPVEIQNNGGLIVSSLNQSHMLFVDGINDAVGIQTDTPTATLSVNGTANKIGGGTWAVFSDARLKENISTYTEGLELITKVRPINFSYNAKMRKLLGENKSLNNHIYQGVIAQELQKIAPDMVREVSLGSEHFLEADPNKFIYALINAVKEQQKMISKQAKEIEAIKLLLKN